jgi:ribonucleoside-diphosphate reductase alpha chain
MTGFARFGVTPETLVLTDKGHERISTLDTQEAKVWNGQDFEETSIFKVAENVKILRIATTTGVELECSEDQIFYHQPGHDLRVVEAVKAFELEPGMRLVKSPSHPLITYGEEKFPHAYSHGFYTGVEKYHRRSGAVSRAVIFGKRRPILDTLDLDFDKTDRVNLHFVDSLPGPFEVPLGPGYSLETRLEWLAGLVDGGFALRKTKPRPLYALYTENWDFLVQLKLFFQIMGADVRITENQDLTRAHYSMRVSGRYMQNFKKLNIPTVTTEIKEYSYVKRGLETPKVTTVEDAYRTSDVYNFVGTEMGAAVFNGLYTASN